MSRRGRAAAFAVVALGCAGAAAAIADGYGDDVAGRLGELRPVVVAAEGLRPGEPLGPRDLRRLEVRRVPARFAPPDALASPDEALGRAPATSLPAGAYVLASQLRAPRRRSERGPPELERGRRPVQIAVTGAEALAAAGGDPEGSRVDVVVTTEPGPGSKGRTRVAASGVELLSLRDGGRSGAGGGDGAALGAGGGWSATLALTRSQALHLIQAENFARQVRLMPHVE